MDAIRVLVADDEPEVRAALADLVASDASLELVGAAADADEALALARARRPDVALVDVKMPGGGGVRAAREIIRVSPQTRVLALSAYEDRQTVLQMLAAGAVGYLVKGTSPDEIVRAIARVVRGQTTVSTEVMTGLVHELSTKLRGEALRSEERREKEARIRRALSGSGVSVEYQPIVDLARRSAVGREALARFRLDPRRTPDRWFAEAVEVGLGLELELFAVRAALRNLPRIPLNEYLSLNLSHRAATSVELLELLGAGVGDRVVVEITEHEPVEDYAELVAALARLRALGVRVAIDDAGAGFSSLRHTLMLDPNVIKLDISLTRGIDASRGQRALAAALISFAEEVGAEIVAEGIETDGELRALAALGVRYGQGFFLARPAPLP